MLAPRLKMGITVIRDPDALRRMSRDARRRGERIALVPTMGALHEGHLSLVDVARGLADRTVLSVFVNPIQFGEGEDYEAYPRDLERDRRLAEARGVDVLFCPERAAMYPLGDATRVEVGGLTDRLCGASRPGHFRGVTTVVTKLLAACEPDVAVFGRKDYQQWRVVERMCRDLLLGVEIVAAPIVREPDGLALSSRNAYLSAEERVAALALPRALEAGVAAISGGDRGPGSVVAKMSAVLRAEPLARIDYVAAVDARELAKIPVLEGEVLLAGAVFVGRTRLIDNREIRVP